MNWINEFKQRFNKEKKVVLGKISQKPAGNEEKPVNHKICSLCGKEGATKKMGGMKFHKECRKKVRKQAKNMGRSSSGGIM